MTVSGNPTQTALDPGRTVAILFGASEWELFPNLHSSKSYKAAADAVLAYLISQKGLSLPEINILNLFSSSSSVTDQDKEIGTFLKTRISDRVTNCQDVIVYYIGHGSTLINGQFIFILRSTEQDRREITAYRAADLARTLRVEAPVQRKWLFLDCCASASAFTDFKPSRTVMDSFRDEANRIFPPSGTALFCACSADAVALVDEMSQTTMFTGALIDTLTKGDPRLADRLTLEQVSGLSQIRLTTRYGPDGVRPELYTPDQRKGDISLIPCFPNAARLQQPLPAAMQQLLAMSQSELDTLFAASPVGDIPNGEAVAATVIIAPGTKPSREITAAANLFAWRGKVFDAASGSLRHVIVPFGLSAIVAKVYEGPSWLDGKKCIVLDYSETSVVAHWIRDEIRLVGPGLYLGKVYWDKSRLIDFALQFSSIPTPRRRPRSSSDSKPADRTPAAR